MGWNPVKEAEKKAKQAVDKIIRPAVNAGKSAVDKVGDEAEDSVRAVRKKAESGVRAVGEEVKEDLQGIAEEVEEGLTEKLPELVENSLQMVLTEISKASFKPALQKAAKAARTVHRQMQQLAEKNPKLVDAIDNWERTIEVEVNVKFALHYDNFYSRAQEVARVLDKYANEGIKPSRTDIIGFLRAAGPSRVSYGVGAELSIGVQVGASFSETVPCELFLELADIVLKELGVPE